MPSANRLNAIWYVAALVLVAGATAGITALLLNIQERKEEGKHRVFEVVKLDENSVDPKEWGKNFPRHYDGYLRTVDTVRTRHGGSEAIDKLTEDPFLKRLYAGYAFSLDFREDRGHAYMLKDQDETERVKQRKQPGACLHCHASPMPAYAKEGGGHDWAHIKAGFEKVCAMDWKDARKLVEHPVTCLDCHEPNSAQLRVTRPAFIIGIQALARSNDPVPHLPSIERWRKGKKDRDYDPNTEATRQELRSLACAQCHVEYYFQPKTFIVTYPWSKGLKAEQMEAYYDEIGFKDWAHKETDAPMLKAQHPEFELWSQGIHARSGVSCADCHMPYKREGAIKISDHHVRSPMLNVSRACQVCHRYGEDEIQSRVATIQDRTAALAKRAEGALGDLYDSITAAKKGGVGEEKIKSAQSMQRKSQWRLDFILSENSLGFHAPQESARILGEAIDFARQGEKALR